MSFVHFAESTTEQDSDRMAMLDTVGEKLVSTEMQTVYDAVTELAKVGLCSKTRFTLATAGRTTELVGSWSGSRFNVMQPKFVLYDQMSDFDQV